MSIGTIILIILVIALLGGFSGLGGGPFYGTGYYGGGGLGLVIIYPAFLFCCLMGRLRQRGVATLSVRDRRPLTQSAGRRRQTINWLAAALCQNPFASDREIFAGDTHMMSVGVQ